MDGALICWLKFCEELIRCGMRLTFLLVTKMLDHVAFGNCGAGTLM